MKRAGFLEVSTTSDGHMGSFTGARFWRHYQLTISSLSKVTTASFSKMTLFELREAYRLLLRKA